MREWVKPLSELSADPPEIAYANVSAVSRSVAETLLVVAEKLSSAAVSVTVMPARAATLRLSSAPVMLVVNVWLALVLPSVTARVKLSDAFVFSPSMALSFGT